MAVGFKLWSIEQKYYCGWLQKRFERKKIWGNISGQKVRMSDVKTIELSKSKWESLKTGGSFVTSQLEDLRQVGGQVLGHAEGADLLSSEDLKQNVDR